MKRFLSYIIFGATVLITGTSFAGNEDRAGSAGASELLINPWARSAGMASANVSGVQGIESIFVNIAGLAFADKTEIGFTHTQWLVGSGTQINAAAVAQKIGTSNTIAVSMMSMAFGEWDITTENQPEGGFGTVSPRYSNFALSYARAFSNSIYGGITVRVINEAISNAKATGVAFDAGIQYITGKNDNMKLGIALKNVGTPLKFSGDGYSVTSFYSDRSDEESFNTEQKGAKFELPTTLSIGASYDFLFGSEDSKLTTAVAFNANSFTKDNYSLGLDYMYKTKSFGFNIRAGYTFERGLLDQLGVRSTALTGITGGLTFDVPVSKSGTHLAIDYSYRTSNPFNGVHSVGVRFGLK